MTEDETRIEVKAGCRLQAWSQKELSKVVFTGLKARAWDETSGVMADEKTYNADVYVFCYETASRHEEYNPLDLSQWEFYVLGRQTLQELGCQSLSLERVRGLVEPISYANLRQVVQSKL